MLTLKDFQKTAIRKLLDSFEDPRRDVILKSCTGSGKTIIMANFMNEYLHENSNTVFLWFTPGKGNLEEQSKKKVDKYIKGITTKYMYEVLNSGFQENDIAFINWELLTKKGNNALKDGDHKNFIDYINKAHNNGLRFIVVVDEEHVNDTVKADDIIQICKPIKVIRCSATPTNYSNPIFIEIPEDDVIAEGLIKKQIIINEDFEDGISVESQVQYLLDKALEKQREIRDSFIKLNVDINPLIIVQVPNKNDSLISDVERYLESKHISYDNQLLAIWMSDRKECLDDIEKNNAQPICLIIKQAVATGWDCPRAHILVKLRDNMNETFEIQTIGRIRRMPEAEHYGYDLLDSAYIYTLDEKFVENVKIHSGKRALDARKIFLKQEHRNVKLTKELKSDFSGMLDVRIALKNISKFIKNKYNLTTITKDNKIRLKNHVYQFK